LIGSKRGTKSSPKGGLVKPVLHSLMRSVRRLWLISEKQAVDIKLKISLIWTKLALIRRRLQITALELLSIQEERKKRLELQRSCIQMQQAQIIYLFGILERLLDYTAFDPLEFKT
jgi:hypothetical protein